MKPPTWHVTSPRGIGREQYASIATFLRGKGERITSRERAKIVVGAEGGLCDEWESADRCSFFAKSAFAKVLVEGVYRQRKIWLGAAVPVGPQVHNGRLWNGHLDGWFLYDRGHTRAFFRVPDDIVARVAYAYNAPMAAAGLLPGVEPGALAALSEGLPVNELQPSVLAWKGHHVLDLRRDACCGWRVAGLRRQSALYMEQGRKAPIAALALFKMPAQDGVAFLRRLGGKGIRQTHPWRLECRLSA